MSDTVRQQLAYSDLHTAAVNALDKTAMRLEQKGPGVMASRHEILGILDEEMYEYRKAVHEKLPNAELEEELLDIAVACIFGIASMRCGGTEW